jgi:hypothetical protein
VPHEERINTRIEKFGKMGFWDEGGTAEQETTEQAAVEEKEENIEQSNQES